MKILACGFVIADIIAAGLKKLPAPGETIFAPYGIKLWIGGHPANLSVDLRQLGLEEDDVGLVAAVGADIFGDFIERFLESKKVKSFLQRVEDKSTGKTLVLVQENKDKSFIADPGANLYLNYDHVVQIIRRVHPKILYLACGILGEFDFKVKEVFEICHEYGIMTVLDVVKPYGKDWAFIHPALPHTDIIHVDVRELMGISDKKSLRDGLSYLADKGVKLSIVSRGAYGVLALFKDKYIHQPAFKVRVIDPTGAGDALCAGMIKKLSEALDHGKTLENMNLNDISNILLYGQASGAACVEAIGTTAGVTRERVEQLLKVQGERILAKTSIKN